MRIPPDNDSDVSPVGHRGRYMLVFSDSYSLPAGSD